MAASRASHGWRSARVVVHRAATGTAPRMTASRASHGWRSARVVVHRAATGTAPRMTASRASHGWRSARVVAIERGVAARRTIYQLATKDVFIFLIRLILLMLIVTSLSSNKREPFR